jgi:hypothetical protein
MARYNREELYERVWTMPIRDLARQYGVSDVALGKTCRKLNVPVPGRGYWNKKAANQLVEPRPPLPSASSNERPTARARLGPQQVQTFGLNPQTLADVGLGVERHPVAVSLDSAKPPVLDWEPFGSELQRIESEGAHAEVCALRPLHPGPLAAGARIVRRVHQPKSKLLGLFLGRPVCGQDLFTRNGFDDDDLEHVSALANVGGQREAVIAEGG